MERGAWWATVHEVAKSQTQLSDFHFHRLNVKGWKIYNMQIWQRRSNSDSILQWFI